MTVVFAGGEFGSFTSNDANTNEATTSGTFDSTFARCGISSVGSTSQAVSADFSTPLTTGWLHYRMQHNVLTPTTWTGNAFLTGTGAGGFAIEYFNNQVRVQYYNGSGFTVAFTAGITETALTDIDVYFSVNTASGEVHLYSGGSLLGSSGVIDLSATPNIDTATFVGGQAGGTNTVSEVIAADESTIGWRLGTIYPTAAGTTNTFTTGTYADVDEIVHSDVDAITSDTANQIFLANCNDLAPTASAIKALIVSARAKKGATGPSKMDLAVRTGATNYFSSDKTLTVGMSSYLNVWATNPNTSAAWTASDVASVQIGVKSIT